MRFFAYATMMSTDVMRATCPGARPAGTAVLAGWRADFFRRSKAGGGCMGVVRDGAARVHGVLFDIPEAEVAALDALETGACYHRADVAVATPDGRDLEAVTYGVQPEAGWPFSPLAAYVDRLRAGCAEHGLPEHAEVLAALARAAARDHVHLPPRAIPVVRDVDVLVVGGGAAGVVAAVAAARNGASTALVERYGLLGGDVVGAATGLHSFFNTYQNDPPTERVQVVAGIPWELAGRLEQAEGSLGHVPLERGGRYLSVLTPIDPEVFKRVAAHLCLDAGVELLLHTFVSDVLVERGAVRGVVVESKSGREAIRAKVVVDASGDADVAAKAGAPHTHRKGPDNWGVSLTFRMAGVDLDAAAAQIAARDTVFQLARARRFGDEQPHVCRLAVDMNTGWAGAVKRFGTRGRFLATSVRAGEATQMNCTMFGPLDSVDRDDLALAEVGLRDQVAAVVGFLRENIDGFAGCYPAATAAQVGIRRSRIVHTRYQLTVEDLVAGRQFDDAVGLFGLIDDKQTFIEGNRWYGIPYRCLLPEGPEGLLVAGRCVGADNVVNSSTRMSVHCMTQGQGAGTAAALAARAGLPPSAVDPETLRGALREAGVLLEVEA